MAKKSLLWTNFLLFGLVVALMVYPLVFNRGADFEGADGKAEELIHEIKPNYQPWFSAIWEPPSGEIENLLFVLQGALGAGVVGYYLGYMKGKRETKRE
jgi:cobalt/nickel transport protein